jgi:two-component system, NtrC family, sensor kinase
MARTPGAAERALEGVGRVSEIVSAMRSFAHPERARSPQDINGVLKTSLVLAKNEYKYVATVTTDLGELPSIVGNLPDLSQMLVNLLINAAHAIEDRFGRNADRGHISISTQKVEDRIRIRIRDNGCGIPEAIRHKIFDPFFTTKEVGRGTGQGLSIVHNVVQRHYGKVSVESQVDVGTTFLIDLPIDPPESMRSLRSGMTTGGSAWR